MLRATSNQHTSLTTSSPPFLLTVNLRLATARRSPSSLCKTDRSVKMPWLNLIIRQWVSCVKARSVLARLRETTWTLLPRPTCQDQTRWVQSQRLDSSSSQQKKARLPVHSIATARSQSWGCRIWLSLSRCGHYSVKETISSKSQVLSSSHRL